MATTRTTTARARAEELESQRGDYAGKLVIVGADEAEAIASELAEREGIDYDDAIGRLESASDEQLAADAKRRLETREAYVLVVREDSLAIDPTDYVVCVSPDGWSLHAPGSTEEQIAAGDARALVTGPWAIEAADEERRAVAAYAGGWLVVSDCAPGRDSGPEEGAVLGAYATEAEAEAAARA